MPGRKSEDPYPRALATASREEGPEEVCLRQQAWDDHDKDNRVVLALDDGVKSSTHRLLERGLRQAGRAYRDMILPAATVSF